MEITNPKVTQPKTYNKVVETIANGAIAFIGSGSSARVGYPNWSGLLETLVHEAVQVDPGKETLLNSIRNQGEFLSLASEVESILGSSHFYNRICELFGPTHPDFDDFHEELVKLPFEHIF